MAELKNEKILDFENSNDQLFSIIKNFKLHNLLFKSLINDKLHKKINFENKLKNFVVVIFSIYLI